MYDVKMDLTIDLVSFTGIDCARIFFGKIDDEGSLQTISNVSGIIQGINLIFKWLKCH